MFNFLARLLRSWAGRERISPGNWVKRDQINYLPNQELLTIKLKPKVKIFDIADTNSMDGLLDIGHNVIATDDFDKGKLASGDMVIYQIYTILIVHRIVSISEDANGRIYCCRGDNNVNDDPYLLRDLNIKWLVLGIIY